MKKLFLVLILSISVLSCGYKAVKEDDLRMVLENAYFEGQKDAIEGDIRIKVSVDTCWIWTKSPWDNGRQPIFDPSFQCKE